MEIGGKSTGSGKRHYAWAICLAGTLMMFTAMGLNASLFSVYVPFVIRQNGFSNAQASSITTVRYLTAIFGMLVYGRVQKRIGLRNMVGVGILLQCLSRMIYANSALFSWFCLGAFFSGISYSWSCTASVSIFIGRWFKSHRGKAMAIAATGSEVALLLLPVPLTRLIESRGLHFTFTAEGLLALFLGLLIWLLLRERPEDMGLEPYDVPLAGDEKPARTAKPANSGGYWKQLVVAGFLLSTSSNTSYNHLSLLFTGEGYSSTMVAWILSWYGGMLILGKLLSGRNVDRLGARRTTRISGSAMVTALAFCCLSFLGWTVLPFLAMLFGGLGWTVNAVISPAWISAFLGNEEYEKGIRAYNIAFFAGSCFFNPLAGLSADRFGSYIPAYIFFLICSAACFLLVDIVYGRLQKSGKEAI